MTTTTTTPNAPAFVTSVLRWEGLATNTAHAFRVALIDLSRARHSQNIGDAAIAKMLSDRGASTGKQKAVIMALTGYAVDRNPNATDDEVQDLYSAVTLACRSGSIGQTKALAIIEEVAQSADGVSKCAGALIEAKAQKDKDVASAKREIEKAERLAEVGVDGLLIEALSGLADRMEKMLTREGWNAKAAEQVARIAKAAASMETLSA